MWKRHEVITSLTRHTHTHTQTHTCSIFCNFSFETRPSLSRIFTHFQTQLFKQDLFATKLTIWPIVNTVITTNSITMKYNWFDKIDINSSDFRLTVFPRVSSGSGAWRGRNYYSLVLPILDRNNGVWTYGLVNRWVSNLVLWTVSTTHTFQKDEKSNLKKECFALSPNTKTKVQNTIFSVHMKHQIFP